RQRLATAFRAIDPPLTRAGTPRQRWVKALDGAADGIEVANWAAVLKGKLFENVLLGVPLFDTFEIPRAVLDLIEETCELARCDLARIYALRSAAMAHLSERLADAMARARRNAGADEFHDITRLLGGTDPLCQRPDLHYRLDARVQHILLDEFQDTSLAQWEAIEPLVDELLSGYEGERSAVVVADPKQSIYGWRGGEPLLVRHLSDRYHLAQDELSRSWRSSDVVLESVNRIFTSIAENAVFDRQTMGHMVAREWVKAFAPHTAAKTLPGHVRLVVGPEDEGRSEDRPRLCRRAAELVAELHR